MKKLSISLVCYKPDLKVLKETFVCIGKIKPDLWELVLLDNSEDSSDTQDLEVLVKEVFSGSGNVKIIKSSNDGFGAGHNLCFENTSSEYHLVLNPDIEFEEKSLMGMIAFLERHNEFALLSPSVFGPDGMRHFLCKTNPSLILMFLRSFAPGFVKRYFKAFMDSHEMLEKDYDKVMLNVPYLTGCFMLFRSEIFRKIQGFDEKFFLYYEDADISRRLLESASSIYHPDYKVIHHWQRGAHKKLSLKWEAIKSGFYYSFKWFLK